MHQFVRNLITEWRRLRLPFSGKTVVVATSGGADSVSLLLAMHQLRESRKLDLRIVAAHFNHRLRGAASDSDEEFVRHLTAERGIELAIGRGDMPSAGNLEQNARVARYSYLDQAARNTGSFAVLTGHTIDDQAETFLMNLIRGSGVDGLSGMKAVRRLDNNGKEDRGESIEERKSLTDGHLMSPQLPFESEDIFLIRPLLQWAKRKNTEGFCRDMGVEYKYDTMNEDTAFKRVRIRKVLLPLLEDFNPKIVETLANTAELMQHICDEQTPLDEATSARELEIQTLKRLPKPELYRTLRSWLGNNRGTLRQLDLKHIQAVERLLYSEKSGRIAQLPGGAHVMRSGGKLAFDENKVEN